MFMTIGMWIFAVVVLVVSFLVAMWILYESTILEGALLSIVSGLIAIAVTALYIFGGTWYCKNTASGARLLKDQKSELSNGLMREITITSEEGREIFHYIGKCDIETNGNYILFEDEKGMRQMIYWGIQDTIIITELPDKE